MLTIIGLSLDVVGAAVLAIGLFRPTQPATMGMPVRDSLVVAADRASGITGFAFLASGFVLQGVASATICRPPSLFHAAEGGLLSVLLGTVLAWLIFENLRALLFADEKRQVRQSAGQHDQRRLRFRPHLESIRTGRLPRLWRLEVPTDAS